MIECMQGGYWNVSNIPGCQEKHYGPVPQIDNGFAVSSSNVTFRGQATYQCYASFGLPCGRSTETICCQESGKWEKLPSCLASSCSKLPESPNAVKTILNCEGNQYGTIIREAPVIVCTSVGQCSHSPPVCAKCTILPDIANGFVIDQGKTFFFGDEGKLQCHKGYKLDGSSTIKCGTDQTFANTYKDIDECALSSCDTASTKCTNTPGSFYSRCRTKFRVFI